MAGAGVHHLDIMSLTVDRDGPAAVPAASIGTARERPPNWSSLTGEPGIAVSAAGTRSPPMTMLIAIDLDLDLARAGIHGSISCGVECRDALDVRRLRKQVERLDRPDAIRVTQAGDIPGQRGRIA